MSAFQNPKQIIAAAERAADRFTPVSATPVILNSLPKSGTVLARNLLMGFYGSAATAPQIGFQHYSNGSTFLDLCAPDHRLLAGHFPFNKKAKDFLHSTPLPLRMLILIRHPLDTCYSLARHIFRGANRNVVAQKLKETSADFDAVVEHCILGIREGNRQIHDVESRLGFYLAWQQQHIPTMLIRYEEMTAAIRHARNGEPAPFFDKLFDFCGITPPDDWRDRIIAMSAPALSWTHVEHDSEEDRYPNRDYFLSLLKERHPAVLGSAGYP